MFGRRIQKSTESFIPPPLPLEQCLAKSHRTAEGAVLPGRLVLSHCQIVGEVARAMIGRMPHWLRLTLFPPGSELIAAAHDIGKVSPTFQKKIYSALSQENRAVLSSLTEFNAEAEKLWGGHGGVSQAAAHAQNTGKYIPEILGQHHGFSPPLGLRQAHSEVFGGASWQAKRAELLVQLKEVLDTQFPIVDNALQARVLSGLTTVSDWIGSGSLFEDPNTDWRPNIEQALDLAGFIQPRLKPGLSFVEVFSFSPINAQIKLFEAVNQRGIYILEAPMGSGKTEAALFAAYQLLQKKLATGIYFALPTQLTSDKIHERVNAFLDRILDDDSPHKQALLVHGNAWLKQFEMGEEGNPGGAWFVQGKRGILAPFAVGTIDQALMAVMNVKHGFVRTFGLAGKVVILDEVHSYDGFTGTILDALVAALRQLSCTVLILSATLTQERRTALLGMASQETPCALRPYPLITAQPHDVSSGDLTEVPVEQISDVSVSIAHHFETDALGEALCRAEEGQQVLWIENTVNDAQGVYRKLAARGSGMRVECGLLHSRFIKADRAANEDAWVTCFGKGVADIRKRHGRILVGTQVLEQSLDIDADFLVTRIAPTDMLLQRLGRLWRHAATARPPSARREAWILSPDLATAAESPELTFGATTKVYAPYVLCRSLAVWQDITHIRLPGQIRGLIEATYAPQKESEHMARHLHNLETARSRLKSLALQGLAKGGTTQPEEKAQTRHSELESNEVLLIRAYQQDQGGQGRWITLLNDERLWVPNNGRSLKRQQWREISAKLMQNTLKVADYLAPNAISKKRIDWLSDYFYLGRPEYEESVMLRVALVDEDGTVRSLDHSAVNDNYHICYDNVIGYRAEKRNR